MDLLADESAQISLALGEKLVGHTCELVVPVLRHTFGKALHGLSVDECVHRFPPHVEHSEKNSQALYVLLLKALFELAVADKLIAESPAAKLRPKRLVKPIRITPTFDDFKAIIADVRNQSLNADAEDSADLLEFMGLIGVGQAEAGGVKKQHVDLANKQPTFFRFKTKTPYTVPIFPQTEALVA